MSRRVKLFVNILFLFTLLLSLGYVALYHGIPIFLKNQLPNYLSAHEIHLEAFSKQIVFKAFTVTNFKKCPGEALAFFSQAVLGVKAEEVKIRSLALKKGELYLESLRRCGLPDLGQNLAHDFNLIGLDDFFVTIENTALRGAKLTIEKGSLSLEKRKEKYGLREIKVSVKDDYGGSHLFKGTGEFSLKDIFALEKLDLQIESRYPNSKSLISELWPNVDFGEAEIYLNGKIILNGQELDLLFRIMLEKIKGGILSLLSEEDSQKGMVFFIRIKHSLHEGFVLLKQKIGQEIKTQFVKKLEKKATWLLNKLLP